MVETYDEFKTRHSRYIMKKRLFIIACMVVTILAIFVEVGTGQYEISFSRSLELFLNHIRGIEPTTPLDIYEDSIVWDRLPTAIGAIGVGAILGICGCAMQSSMKNPLADPYMTGISSGASLGVALMLVMGISMVGSTNHDVAVMANAFLFSLIPAGAMVFFTVINKNLSTNGIILVGIAVMFIFNAMTTVLKYYATDVDLAELYYWNIGSVNPINWSNYYVVIAAAIACVILLQYFARQLNVLTMNDASAQMLGINPRNTRIILLVLVSLFTAIAVCYTGTIGFVGLVGPHVCRMFLGSDNKYLLPASAMSGAMILLVADCIAKNVTMAGLPAGVITAVIGGPVFLLLLIRQRKNIW